MRVLWLTPGFPANELDQNCLPPLQLLARALQMQGVELHIISLDYPFDNQAFSWHEIPVRSSYGSQQKWFRWSNWFRMIRYAQAAHQEQKFDLIHSFWLGPAWLIGQHLQQRWNIPHWTTLMGQDVLPANKYRHLLRARKVSNLIAVSDFQQAVFEKTTGFQAGHTIPWGVKNAEILANFPRHRPVDILGCGSLISVKNWSLWIQVVAEIARQNPSIKAELIGEGPYRKILEQQILEAGLAQNITLRGSLPRAVALARMLESKVLLHTARFESFGFVLAEAAMCGCRVVSTPVGIAPSFSAPGQSLNLLLDQTLNALDQPLLETPNTPFTMEETARRYLHLYHSI